jgi:hypothetical protein
MTTFSAEYSLLWLLHDARLLNAKMNHGSYQDKNDDALHGNDTMRCKKKVATTTLLSSAVCPRVEFMFDGVDWFWRDSSVHRGFGMRRKLLLSQFSLPILLPYRLVPLSSYLMNRAAVLHHIIRIDNDQ